MAYGERCKKCGYDQTAHQHQQHRGFSCSGFESGVVHLKRCPRFYEKEACAGNCQGFIAYIAASQARDAHEQAAVYRYEEPPPRPRQQRFGGSMHSVLLITAGGRVLDIGS